MLLDGLLGTGSKGALRNPLIGWLRKWSGCGSTPEHGSQRSICHPALMRIPVMSSSGAVTADITFMIGNAKRGLLTGHAANFTGALALVPVES